MRLDSAQLNAFATVIDEGSFERAATALHVTRSAVSQRVKLLEERVGQVLVRRATPCTPTEAGQALYRHAREVALSETDALATIGGGQHTSTRLAIGVNADSLATWFPHAMAQAAEGQSITFDIHVEDQDHSANLLREGRRDGRPAARAGLQGAAAGHAALPGAGQPRVHAALLCSRGNRCCAGYGAHAGVQPQGCAAGPVCGAHHAPQTHAARALAARGARVCHGHPGRAGLGHDARPDGAARPGGWHAGRADSRQAGGRAAVLAILAPERSGAAPHDRSSAAGGGAYPAALSSSVNLKNRRYAGAPRGAGLGAGRSQGWPP